MKKSIWLSMILFVAMVLPAEASPAKEKIVTGPEVAVVLSTEHLQIWIPDDEGGKRLLSDTTEVKEVTTPVVTKYVKVNVVPCVTREVGQAKWIYEHFTTGGKKYPYSLFLSDNSLTAKKAELLPAGKKLNIREAFLKDEYKDPLWKVDELKETANDLKETVNKLEGTKAELAISEEKVAWFDLQLKSAWKNIANLKEDIRELNLKLNELEKKHEDSLIWGVGLGFFKIILFGGIAALIVALVAFIAGFRSRQGKLGKLIEKWISKETTTS